MATPIQCPECDTSMKVADEVIGKKVRCKSCKAVFRAESSDVEVAEDDEPAPRKAKPVKRAARDDDDERPRKASGKKKRKAKPKSQLPLILGLVGGFVVLVGVAVGAYLVFGRSEKPEPDDGAGGGGPNVGRYRQDELFGPGEGGRPKASGPPTLTAEQRKILGKWRATNGPAIKTLEFKADGEVIVGTDAGGGRINEDRGRLRFIQDKTFVINLGGLEVSLFTFTITELEGSRMVLVDHKVELEHIFERTD
jgi:predicted Zn finger-like uncharacterized protein